jgi:hypothetical protein
LRHTSGQGRAFDDHPAIFGFVERYMEYHADILPLVSLARTRETFFPMGCLC